MGAARCAIYMACGALLLLAGCATSPEVESRRQALAVDIEAILGVPLDATECAEPKRCLADHEYRHFQALGDRHMLFDGRRGKQWINTLRSRCPDVRHRDILVVKSFSGGRLCDMDQFQVAEWFDWPWYRRWPWHWGRTWGTGVTCSLGKFQPVTEDQIARIGAVLEGR